MKHEFLWGAATSAHQIEGYNDKSDWWQWELDGNVEGGVCSGAATDHRNRFREDLKLAKSLGINSYRFSIEWARIEPEQGVWDKAALDWYKELISECLILDLTPMVTLHHFTLPMWLAKNGGIASKDFPDLFEKYSRVVYDHLGSKVFLWCTINEPLVLVVGSYLGRFMPPAVFDPKKASLAIANLLEAHIKVYKILKQRNSLNEVGFAHNMMDVIPYRKWHLIEVFLASFIRKFYNRAWLDAVTGKLQKFGIPFLLPTPREVQEAIGKCTTDFIGVNYYGKAYVCWKQDIKGDGSSKDIPVGILMSNKDDVSSDLDWAIHPNGFGRILRFVGRYNLPIYITENGIADKTDHLRSAFLKSHLKEIAVAIQNGIKIKGYFHWSLLDNFEWIKGFWPRFGLIEVDYKSHTRKIRSSATYYSKIIAAHHVDGRYQSPLITFFNSSKN